MLFIPVIKNPMDLGTMQKKLRSGQYKTKNQFAHDLNLIWDNCLVYNASPTHPLRRNATFMRRKANHLLEFLSDKHESKDLLAQWQLSSSTTSNMPRMSSDVASTSADILSTSSTGTFKGSGGNNNNNNNTNNDKVGAHLGGSGMSIDPTVPLSSHPIPLPQRYALRRTTDSSRVFHELDVNMSKLEEGTQFSHLQPSASTSSTMPTSQSTNLTPTLDVLKQVSPSTPDPLSTALRRPPATAQQRWWSACSSDAMLCAGTPVLRHECYEPPARFLATESERLTSRLPTQRPGVPRMMARNIRMLQRLYHTHNKLYQLAEAVELDLPIPPSLGEISSSEEEDDQEEMEVDKDVEAETKARADQVVLEEEERNLHAPHNALKRPEKQRHSDTGPGPANEAIELCVPYVSHAPPPRLSASYAHAQASWQVQTLLAHAGFEGTHSAPVQVLADVAIEYLMGLGRTLRLYMDQFVRRFDPEDMIHHVLSGRGNSVATIEAYVTQDIERYGQRLKEWRRKQKNALRDQLQCMGGSIDDTDLLARDGEAFALGHFAAGLGDDFFGFREMGLESELGVSNLAVPSRLFFGGSAPIKAASGVDVLEKPAYALPPPPVPLVRCAVPAQIGLVRPWYMKELGSAQVLAEDVPERPRFKVPTSGKLPPRPMVSQTTVSSQPSSSERPSARTTSTSTASTSVGAGVSLSPSSAGKRKRTT